MKPTLVILAAGMASRYGSMKQIQGFGPSGETIMDYSIYDAIRAGFGKVVFIIREDFADHFKAIFEPKLKDRIAVDYVYQELNSFTNGFNIPTERTKPWGTAHAVLCAKNAVKEPFAVINADDFYGRDAFQKAHDFLAKQCSQKLYAIVGYELVKTLSENGSVSRGVCEVDPNDSLISITERTKIYTVQEDIVFEENEILNKLDPTTKVSMNFWCFDVSVFDLSEKLFESFLETSMENPKSEFFIPIVADNFIKNENGQIKVIPTSSQWFGVTYKEDADGVQECLNKLIESNEYPQNLWV